MTAKKSMTETPDDLLTKAMLVRFSSSCWGAKKNDPDVNREVAKSKKSTENMSKVTKILLKSEAREAYRKIAREAYRLHRSLTLPWDEGTGLLPAARFWEYNEKMEALKRKADQQADTFASEYKKQWDDGLSEYKERLGDWFEEDDYPHPSRIRSKFGIRIRVRPITNPNDFRVQLGSRSSASVKSQIAEDMKADLQEAMREPYRRLHKVVAKIHRKLSDADATFRDSLIENAKELVDLLPDLNVTNDPELAKLITATKKELCVSDIQALRKDEDHRAEVAKSAEKILKNMKGYAS